MRNIFFLALFAALLSCKKDGPDELPLPNATDTIITYPLTSQNLLALESGTILVPGAIYDFTSRIGRDASLKVVLKNDSSNAAWIFLERIEGWTISEFMNGRQELVSADTGLIHLQVKFESSGNCIIEKFENNNQIPVNSLLFEWHTNFYIPKFIIAGQIDSLHYKEYNNLLRSDNKIDVKINDDDAGDLFFESYYSSYYGGMMGTYEKRLNGLGSFEILTDTSLKSVYNSESAYYSDTSTSIQFYSTEKINMPQILDLGDTINYRGTWMRDSVLTFFYKKSNIGFLGDTTFFYDEKFEGWNDLTDKYFGYRFIENQDTLYGWMKFESRIYDIMEIFDSSYK